TATTTFTLTVTNVAPTLTISGAAGVNEGATYTLNLSRTDPGPDTISSWAITWGDGSPVQSVTGNPSSVTHVYADGTNSCTISATATDEDGAYTANALSVTVNNVAPTITDVTVPDTGTEGSPVTLTAAATDPAGALDPLVFQWTIPQRD